MILGHFWKSPFLQGWLRCHRILGSSMLHRLKHRDRRLLIQTGCEVVDDVGGRTSSFLTILDGRYSQPKLIPIDLRFLLIQSFKSLLCVVFLTFSTLSLCELIQLQVLSLCAGDIAGLWPFLRGEGRRCQRFQRLSRKGGTFSSDLHLFDSVIRKLNQLALNIEVLVRCDRLLMLLLLGVVLDRLPTVKWISTFTLSTT